MIIATVAIYTNDFINKSENNQQSELSSIERLRYGLDLSIDIVENAFPLPQFYQSSIMRRVPPEAVQYFEMHSNIEHADEGTRIYVAELTDEEILAVLEYSNEGNENMTKPHIALLYSYISYGDRWYEVYFTYKDSDTLEVTEALVLLTAKVNT
jgi:hypothetical protein